MKYLDKSAKKFLNFSIILTGSFIVIILLFIFVYRNSTLNIYNNILLFLILLTIIITLTITALTAAVLHTHRKRYVRAELVLPVKYGLKLLMPIISILSFFKKTEMDALRGFYIEVNNILVESGKSRYNPAQVLVLLPHCLQNSDCQYKITGSIKNCKMCGGCCIGSIAKISEELGVRTVVVTGGTAARNLVKKIKPAMILSVACERDLAAGIMDIEKIPVIGLTNKRPNGPCTDTTVDVESLRSKLEEILQSKDSTKIEWNKSRIEEKC